MIHSIGPINVCTNFEINRYKIDEVRKYAKIVLYLTSHDAKTVGRASWGISTSDRYFSVTLTLTFDLCSIFVTCTAHDVLEYPCEVL